MTSRARPRERPRSPAARSPLAAQVAALAELDRTALLALWADTLGTDAPRRLSRPLLRRMLAWELQARELGGLSAPAARKLERLAEELTRSSGQASAGAKAPRDASPRLRPGGRLLREWGGATHVVDVVEGGFLWRDQRHRSLSAIARAITGTHWSGPRFFGLADLSAAPTKTAKRKGKRPPESVSARQPEPRPGPEPTPTQEAKQRRGDLKAPPAASGRRAA